MDKETERSIEWLVEEIMRGSTGEDRNMEEKELIKRGKFRERTERLVRSLMLRELDKAREEGYKKGYIDGQIEKINKPKPVVSEFDKTSYLN